MPWQRNLLWLFLYPDGGRQCRRSVSTLAVTQAVRTLPTADTARYINSLTDRQPLGVDTTANGVGSVNSISASIQCAYAVCSKDDVFLQLWLIISFLIVAMRHLCGVNLTGKLYASHVTTKRRGRKIKILFIHTEKPPGV